jgi:hypothetical protein
MDEEGDDMSETNRDRFVRIAEARTNKIINMLRLLGNCSNKSNYEYTEEDIKKIYAAIDNEVKASKSKFLESKNTINDSRFHL